MAEGGSNVTAEETDEESLFLICGICRKASLDSKPKLLPCLHSFCFNCLEERYNQQQQDQKQNPTASAGSQGLSRLKCPTCGQEFLVPQKGISGFLDNQFMLESLSKISRKKENNERVCTSCEDKSPATSYCLDCADWLCDACVQAHQRVRVTKDHTVQTMEEYRASATSSFEDQRPIFCTVHPHEPLKLFCGNCEKLTCRDCQLLEHKDHKYQFVKESACSYREYLRAQLNRLYEQAQPLTESIKDIEKAARGLQEREEVITTEIHKACETLVKAVKQRESVLITELKALVHFKHKLLAKQNKDLRLMQKILQHNYGFTRHVLKSSSDMTLLYSKKQLSSRIQNLLSLKYKVNPVAHSDLKFSMDAEKMAAFIGKIGSVITPGDKAPMSSSQSVRLDSSFRPVASTSGIQQAKASTSSIRDSAHAHRVNPYETLSSLNKRLVSTPPSTIVSSLTVKMSNGQINQISSSNSQGSGPKYPSNDGMYQVNNKVAMAAASHSPKPGQVSSTNMLPKNRVGPQATMKYTSSLASGNQMNVVDFNKTKPLHHYLGGSPPQSALSSGTSTDTRSFSPHSENGLSQGMITNVRSLKNSYIRRSPSIKRSHSSSGLPTSPSQIRIKQERQDGDGEYASCSGFKKQQQEDAASGESGIEEESTNEDWCAVCRNGGELLCCDTCPRVFHLQCHVPAVTQTPSDSWSCGLCLQLDAKALQAESANSLVQGANKRRSSLSGLMDWERKICEKILLELFCHADSIPFQQRVSKSVPNYYKVIANPMDLSTMRAKLQPQHFQHYSNITEFLSDCKLIFQNCQTFNDENSEVGRMGNNLELYFMTMIQKYLPDNVEIPELEPASKKRREDPKAFIHSL